MRRYLIVIGLVNAAIPISRTMFWDIDPAAAVPSNCLLIYTAAVAADQKSAAAKTSFENSLVTQCSPCLVSAGQWGVCPYCLLLYGGCSGQCP